jgi:endonuclease-3
MSTDTLQQADKVSNILREMYPRATIALRYRTPWELLVAVILSAQCTDIMVNKVTEKLFSKYTTLEAYVNADIKIFEQDIHSTGFYHNKAKNILAAAKIVQETFSGKVPRTMEEILTIPGVARKTANVVLGNAYGVVEGIAVDTHVHRISQRLRMVDMTKIGGKKIMVFEKSGASVIDYIKDADPNKIEQQLMRVVPRANWFGITYMIIDHGRAICKAQNPQCRTCPLSVHCPASRV